MPMILFCLVGLVGLAAAGEEPLPPTAMDPHHHVTTVCIQVHGHSPMCGPMVNPEAAHASQQLEAARGANMMTPAANMMAPAARGSDQLMFGQPARGAQFQPNDAVLQGYYDEVPVYKMRSPGDDKNQQQFLKAGQPCPEPASRSSGSVVSVVQPNSGLLGYHNPLISSGIGGLGGIGLGLQQPSIVTVQQPGLGGGYLRSAETSSRTIPIAPWGVEQQQQQMRASQFAAARSQQMAAMRAAGNVPDCPDQPQLQPMRSAASRFQGQQQQMRQIYTPQSVTPMRESQSDILARQCEEQEQEIKKKSDEIFALKKQLDRLSSRTEKTTVDQKTVSVKSSSATDSLQQKDDASDDKLREAQIVKKKK